jgi:hypothetical protein
MDYFFVLQPDCATVIVVVAVVAVAAVAVVAVVVVRHDASVLELFVIY